MVGVVSAVGYENMRSGALSSREVYSCTITEKGGKALGHIKPF
jgi:hypothetical protein